MAYVPPHRRPGFVKQEEAQAVAEPTGARFKSTQTGLPSHNITMYRFPEGPPQIDVRRLKQASLKSRRKRKPAIKTRVKKSKPLREVKSDGPEKRRRVTMKAKSK